MRTAKSRVCTVEWEAMAAWEVPTVDMVAKWAATMPMVVRATTIMVAWVDTNRDHMPVCKAAMVATETNRTASTVGE